MRKKNLTTDTHRFTLIGKMNFRFQISYFKFIFSKIG